MSDWNSVQPATRDIQAICEQIVSTAEIAVEQKFSNFTAERFIMKLKGEAKYYIIKVIVDLYRIHVKVYVGDKGPIFCGYQNHKTEEDAVVPF